ncbi:HPr family phosphocarrier protein [Ectobacillus ponti]|uniref:HPr family phosphocarrier protein n=1 Tax=Ectobacillus ponti TaxID=2961894 RepID=A0AA42BSX8_9BACI|nr:HPr family phosphocarrier protein [Ectobacillus ponti]MCP8968908.1 HPr family phosphocarrier protein [Ectobacillus ponti]
MRIADVWMQQDSSLILFQEIVNCASRHEAEILLRVRGRTVDVKSMLGLCSLMWYAGDLAELRVCGDDEEEALQSIKDVLSRAQCGHT